MEQNKLTLVEQSELTTLETVIETGLQTFYKVGEALLKIKENKLYRSEFDTFENYCLSKWNISKAYGNRLIQASEVINNLTLMGVNSTEIISSERKARILSKFSPEIQRLIIQDLQSNNLEEGLTASFLEGFSKAYLLADSKVKEQKKEWKFTFDNELDLIEHARQFIKPVTIEKEVVKEVIKEVKVTDNSLLEEKNNKISELNKRKTEIVPSVDHNYFFVSKGVFYERFKNNLPDKKLFKVKFRFNSDKIINVDIYNKAFKEGLFDLKVGDILYLKGFFDTIFEVVFINEKKNKIYLKIIYEPIKNNRKICFDFTNIGSIIDFYSKVRG